MKFCYQVATPDVAIAPSVTSYQGALEKSFQDIAALGYDQAELMTVDPDKLDWTDVKKLAEKYNLTIPLICTGEVYGQLGISFVDPDPARQKIALDRMRRIIDFASFLGANVNVGRIRGQYTTGIPRQATYAAAVAAFRQISTYAAEKNVMIALETINTLQSNFINTMAEGAAFVDTVGHPNFRLMADVFHMNMEEKDICRSIKDYAAYIIYVHLSDSNRRYPGSAGLNFQKVIQAFQASGYDGTFSVEVMQVPDQKTSAQKSMECLKPIFAQIYGG